MQKWEYRTVWFDAPGTFNTTIEDSVAGKIKVPSPFSEIDYLNKLGEEGWEVVAIHNPSWKNYFFKRPKP